MKETLRRAIRLNTAVLVAGLATAGAFGVLALALIGLSLRADDIQSQRFDASKRACEVRREQSRAIVGFIVAVTPELERRARRAFPTDENCAAYAAKSVDASPRK